MFYFGDLAFWCIAEGASGFFIVCVPCLPKIIKETLCGKRARKIFGFKSSKGGTGALGSQGLNDKSLGAWGSSSRSAVRSTNKRGPGWGTTTNAYYEMGDDEIALHNIQEGDVPHRSDSAKSKRVSGGKTNSSESERGGIHVTTNTTVVVVTEAL